VLGVPLIERAALAVTSSRLRILAYHEVPEPGPFRRHLEHLHRHYAVVPGARVASWVCDGEPLPPRAVWITFDDGRPSVIRNGLPELVRLGLPATMFVCPGLFDDGAVFWQSVVLAALAAGGPFEFEGRSYIDRELVIRLKSVPDEQRRQVVEELAGRLAGRPPLPGDTVSIEQALQWMDAGMEVGNHTWDHPCLDRCTIEEQARQVSDAHRSISEHLGRTPQLFAYPNGDWTPEVEAVLAGLDYRIAPLFDHRLVARRPSPFRLSRLRVDADAPMDRFRAILSGAHSAAFHARERRGVRGARS
jgi:peptidoglycan/xylan/chitin deacetylase (PgdA/CDA1 family)